MTPLGEPRESLEDLAERPRDGLAVAASIGAHPEVLEHAHLRKEPAPLRRVGEPERDDAMRAPPRDVGPTEDDAPAAGAHQP